MKARLLCLLALAPGMLEAQIVLYSLNGIAPSPLGSVYGYGQVAAGDSMIVRFRALNTGTTSVTITCQLRDLEESFLFLRRCLPANLK